MAAAVAAADATFRAATLADLDAIVANNVAMARETEGLALPPATAREGARRVLEEGGDSGGAGSAAARHAARYYVLSDPSDAATLLAQLMVTLEWSDWRAADVWWVQSVYVPAALRGRGLFRRLYGEVRAAAAAAGAAGVRLYADDGNAEAHATYEVPDGMEGECVLACLRRARPPGQGWGRATAVQARVAPKHLLISPPSPVPHSLATAAAAAVTPSISASAWRRTTACLRTCSPATRRVRRRG